MPASTEIDSRTANAACARTLAGRAELDITLDGLEPAQERGAADAVACQVRFELAETPRQQRPEGAAGVWFDLLAAARSEALGADWLPGIATNLAAYHATCQPMRAFAYTAFRGNLADSCPPAFRQALANLATLLSDPDSFALAARRLSLEMAGTDADIVSSVPSDGEYADQVTQEAGDNGELSEEGTLQQSTEGMPGVPPPPLPEALGRDYRAWTNRYDRVVQARHLASIGQLDQLRTRLDNELLPYRHLVARMAHQLQRLLLARQRRYWSFDQEDGQLDSSRLARLIAAPARAQVFRVEQESAFPRTCVTLLLDNSGSMRGHPVTVAALTADILACALERCGIPVEVLGFTTLGWQDNPAAKDWEKAGRPTNPGRLNPLRHIVYKDMDTPWRRARRDIGLLLQDGLLKENIDGEAVAWAAQRLLRRPEARRLLIVVSDGAPMDKATVAANPRGYLDRHLYEVIAWLEKNTNIELRAIGIGHQVSRYYRHAIQLRRVDDLGTALMRGMGGWLGSQSEGYRKRAVNVGHASGHPGISLGTAVARGKI